MEEIYKYKKYCNLTIKYKSYRRKAYIYDIDADCVEGGILTIPEKIDNKETYGIYLDAFAGLQKHLKYTKISIVIPKSVNVIYPINYEKSSFPDCIDCFYFATKQYDECKSLYNEGSAIHNINISVSVPSMTYSISKENVENLFNMFPTFLVSEKMMVKEKFIKIPSMFIIYYGWEKPVNGVWEIDGRLFSYQGGKSCEEFTCDEVMEYAFNNCNIKKIVFKGTRVALHERAVYNCLQLEQIDIAANHINFRSRSICYCRNLAKLRLPKEIYNKDITYECNEEFVIEDI